MPGEYDNYFPKCPLNLFATTTSISETDVISNRPLNAAFCTTICLTRVPLILNIARWVVVILMMLSVKVGVLAVGLPVCPKGASFTSGRTDKQVVAPVESLTVLSLV
ncbi:xanthine/uracil permease family protein [Trichinella spiralis]|uniref:xanthine/uracil permease family protein n=1 Tax=Trichinella spiralis TaxID=6334 RepID=UPI0001EFBCA9|nr:xanthine/uracil permease family protein [Trichinella spiralis]